MSELERPQGERGARRAGRPALAPAGLSEEWAERELERPQGGRTRRRPTPLRLGIIGLGVISRYYVAALTGPQAPPDLRLAAVCDLDAGALAPYRGRIPSFARHRDLLAAGEVDAVVVNVPNDVHYPVVRDALAAGCAVCVEKPLATRLEHGEELLELAAARSLPLLTAFHRRYNDNVLAMRAGLPTSAPIRHVTVRYFERIEEHVGRDRWYLDPERCGGGCVADNGPNALDLVHLLLGPVALEQADVVRDAAGVDRQATIDLRADSGATARVELDWSYPHGEVKDVRVELTGGHRDGADMLAGHPGFKSSLAHEYVGALWHFADVLRGRATSWPDGLEPLRLVTEVYRSERAALCHAAPRRGLAVGPVGGGR